MKRRKWLLTLIGVLLAALALWSAAALFLTTASAEQLPFPLSLSAICSFETGGRLPLRRHGRLLGSLPLLDDWGSAA